MGGNLVTCDLICQGVPSPGVFQSYLAWLEANAGQAIVEYQHRAAGEVWGSYRERAILQDGSQLRDSTKTKAWQRMWGSALMRPSCYSCCYHSTLRPGDLSIGDFWGIEDAHPGVSDNLGISCVIASTQRGYRFLLETEGRLTLLRSSMDLCANQKQPMLWRAPYKPSNRDYVWSILTTKGFAFAAKKLGIVGPARSMKDMAGKMCRLFSKRNNTTLQRKDNASWVPARRGLYRTEDFPIVFAAKHVSDDIRLRSSSGGVFHALAEYVIKCGGVVYGCAFDENLHARHIRCETIEDCERCMGSKYSQSDMGSTLPDIRADLSSGRLVLFTGTPCQVAAIKMACSESHAEGALGR